jgi:[ribosomal protein S18]-alanine N-acetyltransferase
MIAPADDIDRIMAVMDSAFAPVFGEAWSRRQVEDALLIGNCHYGLIAQNGSEPVAGEAAAGFFLSRYGFEEEELLLLAVAPDMRRQGLGAKLLEQFSVTARGRGARRLLLEMRRGNPAEALYLAFGFVPVGERRNYYRAPDGERFDAVTFAWDCE